MSENKIKVSASTTSKAVRVNVSAPTSQGAVTLSQDTSAYNANIAEQWAVSENIVLGQDYSSKYYANKAKESASNAQGFESAIRDVYNGFLGETTEAIENVQGARDEAIANIETSRVEAIDSINSTKTTILNDIEFVADGEKQEIQDLADEIKDNGDTVNTAIEAGVKRLNSIDALKKSQITNCITEIPQNIKLELVDGVLTLKAGSKVIVPNGFEADGVTPKFDEVVIPSDKISTRNANKQEFYVYHTSTGEFNQWQYGFSGDTAPTLTNSSYAIWYDTANSLVKHTVDKGVTWVSGCSLPICLATSNTTQITSIDQVFNGMGYIGSTVWVDKGVKGLIPNGRNEDGSLKNIEFETEKVLTLEVTGTASRYLMLNGSVLTHLNKAGYYLYDEAENLNKIPATGGISYYCNIGSYDCNNNAISNFQPKLPFRAIDYSDSSTISGWGMPSNKYIDLTLGASGTAYTAPANGWVYIRGKSSATAQYLAIIKILDNNVTNEASVMWAINSSNDLYVNCPVRKGEKFSVNYTMAGVSPSNFFRFIYAEGEV